MTEPEKLGLLGLAKGAASETDRVKITDEETLPGGGTRKTERTEVRRAGGLAAEVDRYAVPPDKDKPGKDKPAPARTMPAQPPTAMYVPMDKRPTLLLERYTTSSPEYKAAQDELARRKKAAFGGMSDEMSRLLGDQTEAARRQQTHSGAR